MLIPFAAFTIAETFTGWKAWKNPLILASVIAVFFWTVGPGNDRTVKIARVDYALMFNLHYSARLQSGVDNNNWGTVSQALGDYINAYQPEAISRVNPFYRCKDRNEADIWSYFALLHANRSAALKMAADTLSARNEQQFSEKIKNAADVQFP